MRFFQLLFWLLVRGLYRFRVYGRDAIPATGGCLIVCNRVSLLDRIVLQAACPRLLVIAADRILEIDDIAASLAAGEPVLFFPEEAMTRSGHLLPFAEPLNAILERLPPETPVIAACTDGLWGSIFSYRDGRLLWKRPRGFRRHVGVMFGKTACRTGPELRLAVQELAADLSIRQSEFLPLVHRTFIANAVRLRNLFRSYVIDNAAGERILTWGKMFVAAMCVTRYLRKRLGPEQNVGVWLPTSLGR